MAQNSSLPTATRTDAGKTVIVDAVVAKVAGIAEPLSVYVDLHGTGTVEEAKLEAALPQLVRLTPKGIREHLALNKPIYSKTAAYGHFGRDAEGDLFTWEKTDLVDALKKAVA